MSADLTLTFGAHPITIITDEQGAPWWIADEVCAALAIRNSRDAIARLDEDEKGVGNADTPGGPQRKATINESGLYSLILRSRKPEARAFKRWVTHEVLPAIRKTGSYGTDARVEKLEAMLTRRAEQVTALVAALDARPPRALAVPEADLSVLTEQITRLTEQVARLAALPDGPHPLGPGHVLLHGGQPVEIRVRSTGPDVFDQAQRAFTAAFPGRHLVLGARVGGRAVVDWRGHGASYVASVCSGRCVCASSRPGSRA